MSQPVQVKQGRLDLAILALSKHFCEKFQERTGIDLWETGGAHEFTEIFIEHWGIPREPINFPLTVVENIGLLPKNSRRKLRRAS